MSKAQANWLLTGARIVTPDGVLEDGWVWVSEGKIASFGTSTSGALSASRGLETIDARGGWVVPGFIDVHVHGGAGHDFLDAEASGFEAITRFHAAHGTTGLLATSLTAPRDVLTGFLGRVAAYMADDGGYARVLGAHFEGPFISEKWKGAQNPAYIIPPQISWLDEWVAAFPGVVKMQTLAPETEGALAYIDRLVHHGIVPSCGHTDATYEQIEAAADRGLRHAVHTCNAMRAFHHREPGTVGAVLTDDRISAEVIADGHHVHPGGVKLIAKAKGADKVILVTDAMAAAGMPDGDYELGGLPVRMAGGVARLADSGSLAGSTLTMIGAFRYLIRDIGVSIADASRMASGNAARQLGIDGETGAVAAGLRADLLLLDADLGLSRVWVGGREVLAE